MNSDVRSKISEQQTVKLEKSLEGQKAKSARGVKRDCTEGHSSEYQLYMSAAKQRSTPGHFSAERMQKLFKLLRNKASSDSEDENESDAGNSSDVGRPCRAEVRWYGATDEGLRDERGNVRIWGLNCEIDRHAVLSAKPENKNKSAIEISKLVLAERMDLQMRKELYEKVHGRAYDGGDL